MSDQIRLHEESWRNTIKALDDLLEKVAQDIAKREELPIEEARKIAIRCLAVALERRKMERPIQGNWCECGESREIKRITNGTNHDYICDICKRHVLR